MAPSSGVGSDARARLTIPDVALLAFSMLVLGALWPVVRTSLRQSESIGQGASLVFQVLLPLSICVVLVLIWRSALGGAAR